MLRFTLIPFVFVITSIVLGFITYFIYQKIKRGIEATYKKGAEIANDQQQKWSKREQRKKLPSIVQKGFDDYDSLSHEQQLLPQEWKQALEPLLVQAKEILDEVSYELLENNDEKLLNSVRPFFHHSIDALLQFTQKLSNDYKHMSADQIDKARQNITLFQADLLSHQTILQKSRRMSFDVLMEVIKARLKK